MSVIGLDIGTTGCKAILFDSGLRMLASAGREYPILTPRPNFAEQDAAHVWDMAIACLQEILTNASDHPQALALSVQGEAIIPVDKNGLPMGNAILGMDNRTTEENLWLTEQFGADNLFRRTGIPAHTMNPITKLLWIQKNEPATWKSADRFLLYEDYFLSRLGGEACISPCLASRTQMVDIRTGEWMHDVLDRCRIDAGRMARIAPVHGGPVSTLRSDIGKALGLRKDVLLISGGHDQACAALGSGVIKPGLAMVSTGTAEVIEVAMDTPSLDERLQRAGISVYRHVVPNLYLAMTLNHSGGLSLRWFRDTLCRDKLDQANAQGKDAYELILAGSRPGPTDLLILPHFSGAGTPLLDTTSRAAILGMSFATTQGDIAKAILEGLTFEYRANIDFLKEAGIPVNELHAVGGGAKSKLWMQLKADIGRVPLRIPKVTEAACLGAAMLASVGAQVFPDLPSAVRAGVAFNEAVLPDCDKTKQYQGRYDLYKTLYNLLVPLHRQISDR
ncbi:MAG: hypothetical protein IH624_08665 [Phycisphaerae bacterium]|nr:hypothetical protein [Phycisphaerae bacterium]